MIKEVYISEIEGITLKNSNGDYIGKEHVKAKIIFIKPEKCDELPDFIKPTMYLSNKNLEQENKQLIEENQKQKFYIKYLEEKTNIQPKIIFGDNREQLQNRINKAREYIEHERFKRKILLGLSESKYIKNILSNILEILEGDNDEKYKQD